MADKNRLAMEASPYLLQHSENPVDWYPWGAEALARAKAEDKPILLSIGYAACHWCHVMEHESFEDEAIARRMNELFVNVKVDREERPDLDQIYQTVVQLMGRSGGWPLTVFLTPEQRPFFAGTYFPPSDRHGMPGLPRVLDAVAEAYRERRGDVESQALEIASAIDRVHRSDASDVKIDASFLADAAKKLIARFDQENGGFGKRPKFPNTMSLDVLLRRGTDGDPSSTRAVERALDKMRAGGIWDHLRGGFHRYSTDEKWLVPHFEKMLYDNALLLRSYTDGARVFDKAIYRETVREIAGYLFAEMRDGDGAFFSSQDADSEGHEGKFFVWTPKDLDAALGDDAEAIAIAKKHFDVSVEGNFEGSGATVLSAAKPIDAADEAALTRAKRKMLAHRETRPRPLRDDKVLTSWNGLLLGALADAGVFLHEPSFVRAAEEAFAALEKALLRSGRMGRYMKDGAASSARAGFLDDQSYFANAAIDLYEATGTPRYLTTALGICRSMIDHHWDAGEGGFYFAPDDGESLIARTKDLYDQAIPSGAAMAAILCLRLAAVADASLREFGERQLTLAAGNARENPSGLGQTVLGVDTMARGTIDVVIVGDRKSNEARALAGVVFAAYLPRRTIAWIDPGEPASIAAAPIAAEGKPAVATGAVAYVCRDRSCSAPVSDPKALTDLIAAR